MEQKLNLAQIWNKLISNNNKIIETQDAIKKLTANGLKQSDIAEVIDLSNKLNSYFLTKGDLTAKYNNKRSEQIIKK